MAKQLYSAREAAAALGISLDTLRRWDRAGRIEVQRDAGNRRVVAASEIDRVRGDGAGSHISARNRFHGIVKWPSPPCLGKMATCALYQEARASEDLRLRRLID